MCVDPCVLVLMTSLDSKYIISVILLWRFCHILFIVERRWEQVHISIERKVADLANSASIVADSISPSGHRLTTMQVTMPRIVLAEFNTHRVFSRNSASSRAIPVRKQMQAIINDSFVPVEFGTAVAGMNAGPKLEGAAYQLAVKLWIQARDAMVLAAMSLTTSPEAIGELRERWTEDTFDEFVMRMTTMLEQMDPYLTGDEMLKVSKGLTNRLLEPFMWQTVIVTATEWGNFFALRTDQNAQLEIRTAAKLMLDAYNESTPQLLTEGEWHLPYIQEHELEWARDNPEIARKAVTARCARVSYLTHDTGKADLDKDIALCEKLAADGHMSPFEHAATPLSAAEIAARDDMAATADRHRPFITPEAYDELTSMTEFSANFRGWVQYRREQANQRVFVKA